MSDATLKSVAKENQHLTGGILVANRYIPEATKCRQELAYKNAKKDSNTYVMASNIYGCKG